MSIKKKLSSDIFAARGNVGMPLWAATGIDLVTIGIAVYLWSIGGAVPRGIGFLLFVVGAFGLGEKATRRVRA